jgi:membrane fusion protein, multidrug efflux system
MSFVVLRRALAAVVVLVVIVAALRPGLRYYRYYMSHVSTDDAYVDGTVGLIAPRVQGTVTAVYVNDNWRVKAGSLLLTLDPRDYQARVEQLQAQVEHAKQTIDQLFAQLSAARAGMRMADSQLHQARLDYNRALQLRDAGVVSHEYYDLAATALRVAEADQALASHQVQQAIAALGGELDDKARYQRPIVQQAEAALKASKLDLSYTGIAAPFDGIITHKVVHVGNRVQAGQPLMAVVPVKGLYVSANYKETELTDVRIGQAADVWADIYPGYLYPAHVDSIAMGTGSAFALLPPENATGNWVKVVQRIPVKIVLNQPPPPDKPLRLGLSVEVAIDITDKSGPLLTSTLQEQHLLRHPGTVPYEVLQGGEFDLTPSPEPPFGNQTQIFPHK